MPREDKNVNEICVCILAYNEQKHITNTIQSILAGNEDLEFDIVVYANGCTDKTAEIVREMQKSTPNLRLRELSKASKPNAWNTALAENSVRFIVFSDGDVRPEPGSVVALRDLLSEHSSISLVSSQFWPFTKGLDFERRITGFMQIPFAQDFLSGQFYAIRRQRICDLLAKKELTGIPEGIVGEDEFLLMLTGRDEFHVAQKRVFYEPPCFDDFCKYFARLRWQEEQIAQAYGALFEDELRQTERGSGHLLRTKLSRRQSLRRTLLGFGATALRSSVKWLYRARIDMHYDRLGLITADGGDILSTSTRSESAK
jgi:glycosyltransferase involved in cell wall biosynthesis